MGLFRKKSDPISERAKAIDDQIAGLEQEIRRLSAQKTPADSPAPSTAAAVDPPSGPVPAPAAQSTGAQPRLRSTAYPLGPASPASSAPHPASREPVLDQAGQNPFRASPAASAQEHTGELGVRRSDLASAWQRFKNNFRGPATSNPKLVNYLAAGSIQGLRPLRYEKRVARNRFLFLVICLVLVLLGIISWVMKH